MTGFDVLKDEFEELPDKKKLTAIFHNVIDLKETSIQVGIDLKKHEDMDKLHHRIQYWGFAGLAMMYGIGRFFHLL